MSREKLKFIIIRTIGNFLFFGAIWGVFMTFGPAFYLEIVFRVNQMRNVRYVVAQREEPSDASLFQPPTTPTPIQTNVTFFGKLTGGDKVEVVEPVSSQFGIVIPKIGANAPIFPNVDPGQPEAYLNVLKQGVAHAAGTVFPGVSGNIYLFAHSTDAFWNVGRYNAIFYLLKDLENGDEIDVFFNGVRHVYRVVNKMIVDPSEVQFITETLPFEQLTLQTCWPPGTTFKRLIVIARPEKDLSK